MANWPIIVAKCPFHEEFYSHFYPFVKAGPDPAKTEKPRPKGLGLSRSKKALQAHVNHLVALSSQLPVQGQVGLMELGISAVNKKLQAESLELCFSERALQGE